MEQAFIRSLTGFMVLLSVYLIGREVGLWPYLWQAAWGLLAMFRIWTLSRFYYWCGRLSSWAGRRLDYEMESIKRALDENS